MAAIVASDIVYRFTTTSGSAGDSTAGAAATSLGKYASTSAWSGGTLHDLFDAISGAENAASQVDYRGLAVLNNNAANTAFSCSAYLSAETAGGASIAIGADTTAASAKGSASAQMLQIASDTTAPSGVSFSSPTTDGSGISMGDIAVANVKGIWIRRTAANTSALSADGFTLGFACDTGSA